MRAPIVCTMIMIEIVLTEMLMMIVDFLVVPGELSVGPAAAAASGSAIERWRRSPSVSLVSCRRAAGRAHGIAYRTPFGWSARSVGLLMNWLQEQISLRD